MKIIIYTTDSKSVAVMCPAPDFSGDLYALAEKDVPAGAQWRIINADQLPSEAQWKWQWTDDGSLLLIEQIMFNEPQKFARIGELKQLLASTDYVALADYDKSKPDVLAQRQAWREELRALEVI